MKVAQTIKIFLKEVYVELKKVNWLSKSEVLKYTLIVLAITVIVAVLLGGMDYVFSKILRSFVFK